ncbi:MAG: outer spore coat protein CotE [Bacilli bacterium]|nr:outer spore coat protein CotE [Bacilli bacterium]
MAGYKEIVTKTVIGKAKKKSTNSVVITPEQLPSTILGCWVINHTFSGFNENGKVRVNGSFDVNVWYSYDSDHKTAVSTKVYNYTDLLSVPTKNEINNSSEIIVRSLMQPTVDDAKINNGEINLNINKELGIEIVGDEKIRVSIEDNEDDYEEIIDEDKIDDITNEIDPEYLK